MDLVGREARRALIVLNRVRNGTKLTEQVAQAAGETGGTASARLSARVTYAETLGQGQGVAELRGPAAVEIRVLTDEILQLLDMPR